jgi:hypothetical protein
MPIDADGQTLTQWILTAFGIGGGGYKLVTHETRIARLETDREKDVKKIDDNAQEMREMKGTLDQVSETVTDIRNLLMRRGD